MEHRLRGSLARIGLVAFLCLLLLVSTEAARPSASAQTAAVIINEILAHTDPPQQDSIELFNNGDAPVDLSGWYFTDDTKRPVGEWYRISEGAIIQPGAYVVFRLDSTWGFGLSEFGETLHLFRAGPDGQPAVIQDRAVFGVSPNGVSLGRYTTTTGAVHFPLQRSVTLGTANTGPRVGPVTISEVMYHPAIGSEYIVVTNGSGVAIPLYDPAVPTNSWKLTVDGIDAYSFEQGTTLTAYGSIVVAGVAPETFRAERSWPVLAPVVGPFVGRLDNNGERVALVWPQPPETDGSDLAFAEADSLDYAPTTPWPPEADGLGAALLRKAPAQYGDDPTSWSAGVSDALAPRQTFLPILTR